MDATPACPYTDGLQALIRTRLASFDFIHREDAAGLKRAAVTIVIERYVAPQSTGPAGPSTGRTGPTTGASGPTGATGAT